MAAAVLPQSRASSEASSSPQAPKSTTYLGRLTMELTPETIAKRESKALWLDIADKTILVAAVALAFLVMTSSYFLPINFVPRLCLRLLSFAPIPCSIYFSAKISHLVEGIRGAVKEHKLAAAKLTDVPTAPELIRQKLFELLPSNATKIQEMTETELGNLRPLIAYHDSRIDLWKAKMDPKELDSKKVSKTEALKISRWITIDEIFAAFFRAVILRPHFTGDMYNLVALSPAQGKKTLDVTSRFGDQRTFTVEEKTEISDTTELTNLFVEAIDAFEERFGLRPNA